MMPTTPITAIRMAPPDRKTLQTLGEHSYAIPDVLATSHTSTPALKLLLAPIKALAVIIILPLYTLFMVVAPSALKNKWLSSIIPKLMYSLEQKNFQSTKIITSTGFWQGSRCRGGRWSVYPTLHQGIILCGIRTIGGIASYT